MEVRPGYKQSEVGVIPEEWQCATVRNIASSARNAIVGGPFGSDLVSRDYVEDGVPVIRGQNLSAQWVSGNFAFVTTAKAKSLEANLARPGDIIFTQRGTLGQVSLVPERPFDYYLVSQSQMKLSVNRDDADPLFFFYVFTSEPQQELIRGGTIQTGVPHINLGILRDIPVQLPPLPEQRAIAKALSDVDALIGALDRLIAKKRALKLAAMQQLLTGQKRLPGFHGEWEVKRLDNFAPLQRGFDLPTSEIRKGDYPVVYSNGVQNHHAKFMVKGPGVVTGRSGTIGNVHFVEQDFWPHNTALWVTDFKRNDPKFVFYLLTDIGLERFATGSGVPTLNRNDVHEFRVCVPSSSAEQTAIAEVLTDMDAELTALEQRRDKTRALKQGMMQELLTGRIRLVESGKLIVESGA
jgi:type I restriction enzyme S subunit